MTKFRVIQTVHHNDGKSPVKFCYFEFDELLIAANAAHDLNERNKEKNQRQDTIIVTYHVESAER